MKNRHDAKATRTVLQPGDKVWLYNPRRQKGKSPKLSSDWEGLYVIVDCLSDVTYRIRFGGNTSTRRNPQKVVHVNRLWKHEGPAHFTWKEQNENQNQDTGEGESSSPISVPNGMGPGWHEQNGGVRRSTRLRRTPVRMNDYVM